MSRTKKNPLENFEQLFGVKLSDLVNNDEVEKAVEQQTEYEALEDARTLEAESVIYYIETKGSEAIWKKKNCKLCGKKFLASYTGVSYCTNECRKDYLASKGMFWDPTGRSEAERWGGTIPKVIGPVATEKLQGMTFPDDEPDPEPIKEESSPVGNDDDDFDINAFISGDLD